MASPDTILTRSRTQDHAEIWRITIPRATAVLSLIAGVFGLVATSLGAAYWVIAPRLDARIDERVVGHLHERAAEAATEHARIRAEMAAMVSTERELRSTQLSRIEADLLYIRTRIDQLYARGR